jgi:hypothetical protein
MSRQMQPDATDFMVRDSVASAADAGRAATGGDVAGGRRGMPTVTALEALEHAAAGFEVNDLEPVVEPSARIAAQRSPDQSGLLLLGEVHGVRENPLIIRALMQVFGLGALAPEWPDEP